MTAAAAAVEPEIEGGAAPEGPSEIELLDVLYEVMAQGAQPQGSKTLEAVERFLHEHARSKKSLDEIRAFFAEQGLPTSAAAYGADPALSELAADFMRERGPASSSFSLDEGQRIPAPSESGPVRRMDTFDHGLVSEHTSPRIIVPPAIIRPAGTPWLAITALGVAAVLAVTAFLSMQNARELEFKLNEARLQQRTTDMALTALEQRAEGMKGALEQSESARRTLSSRFDDFVAQDMQARAAESVALERILGKRFETIRTKALNDALAGTAAP